MSTKSTTELKHPCEPSETRSSCPSAESLLASLENEGPASAFLHLRTCPKCRAAAAFSLAANEFLPVEFRFCQRKASAPSIRQAGITDPVWSIVRNRLWELFQPSPVERGADALAAAANGGRIRFRADPDAPVSVRWTADLILPGSEESLEDGLFVRVQAEQAGAEEPNGTFRLCDVPVSIRKGEGIMSRKRLLEGLDKGGASFTWPDGTCVPGAPVFGSLEA